MINLRTFGHVEIDGLKTGRLAARAQALLCCLSVSHQHKLDRPALCSLLWNTNAVSSRHSLSQLLYALKKCLPNISLVATKDSVALNTHVVHADCIQFQNAINKADWQRAIELYRGPFMQEFGYLTDEFDDWRIASGARFESDAIMACGHLVDDAVESENHDAVAHYSAIGLSIQATNEGFAYTRITSLAAAGHIVRALRELSHLQKSFLLEHGTIPAMISDRLKEQITRIPSLGEDPTEAFLHVRLVGRDSELKQLRSQWKAAKEGCKVLVVSGEPGIGKTRLLDHAVKTAVMDGGRAFFYRVAEVESRLPYSGIVALIREGLWETDIGAMDPQSRHALGQLAPELFSGTISTATVHERTIWEAVVRYFGAASERNQLVLALDNYHWVDTNSRELLAYVSKRLKDRPILMLYAGRDSLVFPTYEDDRNMVAHVHLGELSRTAIDEMIREVEQRYGFTISSSTRTVLVSRVGGRPFYVLDTLRRLRQCNPQDHDREVKLSASTTNHIVQRLRRLPSRARAFMSAAAILNREAPLHLLARITAMPPTSAAEVASILVVEGVLAESPRVRFAHDLMRESALEATPQGEHALWHQRIAETLQAGGSGGPKEIAEHFEHAGELAHAYSYAKAAATQALRLHAYADAEDECARMLRCAAPEDRFTAELAFVDFIGRSGRYNKLRPYLPELEQRLRTQGEMKGVLVCALARFQVGEAKREAKFENLVSDAMAIVHLAEQTDPTSLAAVMWMVADQIKLAGDFDALERFARLLAVRADELQEHDSAQALCIAAILGAASIGVTYAEPLARRALQLSDKSNDQILMARALFARGTVLLWKGCVAQASADYSSALRAIDLYGPDGFIHSLELNLAVAKLEQGDYAAAESPATASLSSPRRGSRAYAFGNLSLIHLRQGRFDLARHYVSALLETHRETPQPWIPVHADALLGLLDLADGDIDRATRKAQRVQSALKIGESAGESFHLHLLCAQTAFKNGREQDALNILARATRFVTPRNFISGSRLQLEYIRIRMACDRDCDLLGEARTLRSIAQQRGAMLLFHEADDLINGLS